MGTAKSLVLAALCLMAVALSNSPVVAQFPIGSVGFRNDLKTPVIIQGVSQVNGQLRRGQPLVVAPGRTAIDAALPIGMRVYTVYDANQPGRVLARDVPVAVLPGRPASRVVRQTPNGQVAIVPE